MKKTSIISLAALCATAVLGNISVMAAEDAMSTDPLQVANIPVVAATLDTTAMPEYTANGTGMKFKLSTPIRSIYDEMRDFELEGVVLDQFAHQHYIPGVSLENSASMFDKSTCGIAGCNEDYYIGVQTTDLSKHKERCDAEAGRVTTFDEFMTSQLADYRTGKTATDPYGSVETWKSFTLNNREWFVWVKEDKASIFNGVFCKVFTVVGDKFVGAEIQVRDDQQAGTAWMLNPTADAHNNLDLVRSIVTEFVTTVTLN